MTSGILVETFKYIGLGSPFSLEESTKYSYLMTKINKNDEITNKIVTKNTLNETKKLYYYETWEKEDSYIRKVEIYDIVNYDNFNNITYEEIISYYPQNNITEKESLKNNFDVMYAYIFTLSVLEGIPFFIRTKILPFDYEKLCK